MARVLNADLDINLGGENASNEVISSQRAVKTYVDNQDSGIIDSLGDLSSLVTPVKTDIVSAINSLNVEASYMEECPALTPSSGVATWSVVHNLGSKGIICTLYDKEGAEIVKNTTINSVNQITVTFNATSNISAKDYVIVIVASNASGGGDSITVDSTISATSTNPLQNKVIYPALSSFLPNNTMINVKLDGTGDFTNLNDAIDFLNNKWSNGLVILRVGSGTFSTSNISLLANFCNIPKLYILGDGINNTILTFSSTSGACIASYSGTLQIASLTITRPNVSTTVDAGAETIKALESGFIDMGSSVAINGSNTALSSTMGGSILFRGGTISNSYIAFQASANGGISTSWGTSVSLSDCVYGFSTLAGGRINMNNANISYANVTNRASQTVGEATNDGWITGVTV